MYSYNDVYPECETLIGKKIINLTVNETSSEVVFECEDGTTYKLSHTQDCCESVYITDTDGDPDGVTGEPLTAFYKMESECKTDEEWGGISQKTTYVFETEHGSLRVTWDGSSNGYYGISVDLIRTNIEW